MILKRLVEYSQRLSLPPRLYAPTPIDWIIELKPCGAPVGMVDRRTGSGKNKRGKRQPAPTLGMLRTSDIRPLLFCDNGGYVLGIGSKGKPQKAQQKLYSFRKLVEACHQTLNLPETGAVHAFYQRHFTQFTPSSDYEPEHTIAFRVNGRLLIDLPQVQQFWRDYASSTYGITGASAFCLVCNQPKPIVRAHYLGVKGIPGGQPTGMALVSANADAFLSYGLEAGDLAPICLDCSEQMLHALNELLQDSRTRLRVGQIAYCFWTREPVEFDITRFLEQPDPNDVKALLQSVAQGGASPPVNANEFYALALSANSARVVVRSYLELTLPDVQRNLARWFERLQLHEDDKPVGVFALARALYREAKDISAHVPETLIRCALTGAPLPMYLLQLAIQRNRAEQKVTENRARLIQAALRSHNYP